MSGGAMSEDPEFRTIYAPPRFPSTTESPVRHAPVVLRGAVVGHLWAATTDDAAGFVVRKAAGSFAFNASVQWAERLRWAKSNGLTPLQALRHWGGDVEGAEAAKAGAISGEVQEEPTLAALENKAR